MAECWSRCFTTWRFDVCCAPSKQSCILFSVSERLYVFHSQYSTTPTLHNSIAMVAVRHPNSPLLQHYCHTENFFEHLTFVGERHTFRCEVSATLTFDDEFFVCWFDLYIYDPGAVTAVQGVRDA